MAKRPHPPDSRRHRGARCERPVRTSRRASREAQTQFDATNVKIQARTGRNLFAAIGIGLGLGGLAAGQPAHLEAAVHRLRRHSSSASRRSSWRARCASPGRNVPRDRIDRRRPRDGAHRVLLPRRGPLARPAGGRPAHHRSTASSSWSGRVTAPEPARCFWMSGPARSCRCTSRSWPAQAAEQSRQAMVLRVAEHDPHARLHAYQAEEPGPGGALAVALPRHDDRP